MELVSEPLWCQTDAMQIDRYIDDIARQLALTAQAGGPEVREVAEHLSLPLQSAIRLALIEALAAAAEELTVELAPGSVELRLRGGEPTFAVSGVTTSLASSAQDAGSNLPAPHEDMATTLDAEEGGSSRINLRMPDSLKTRIEAAATREGRSVNAWLVRAATAALQADARNQNPPASAPRNRASFTGWAQ